MPVTYLGTFWRRAGAADHASNYTRTHAKIAGAVVTLCGRTIGRMENTDETDAVQCVACRKALDEQQALHDLEVLAAMGEGRGA